MNIARFDSNFSRNAQCCFVRVPGYHPDVDVHCISEVRYGCCSFSYLEGRIQSVTAQLFLPLHWNALQEWSAEYLAVCLKSNKDVTDDIDLNLWALELIDKGCVKKFSDNGTGVIVYSLFPT